MKISEIDLNIGNRTYHTNGDTLDLMISTRLPASPGQLRDKLIMAGLYPAVEDWNGLGVSECLIVLAAYYDEGVMIP